VRGRCLRGFLVLCLSALATLLLVTQAAAAAAERPRVLAIELANDINPVTQDYVVDQLRRAEDEQYAAAVILLDTPGGLSTSMEKIYKAELALRIPVIVYVSPAGAEATSAGVFVAQAADVLAMAPATTIGSSTPVGQGGEDLGKDLRNKAVNKFASALRALAKDHGRNVRWADAAVRKASNLPADEARAQNVVDVLAPSLPQLLEQIDGRKTEPKGFVLQTAGARIERVEMSFWKRVLDTVIDPNIIVLLMSLGVIGLTVELWSPGLVFPGAVGGISLIVGLYGLQVLPVSWAGVLLMLLAAGFFAAEVFVVSHGGLALAGAVSFVFGSLLLFDPAGESYQVSLQASLGIAGTLLLFFAFALTKVAQVRRRPVEVGVHSLVGAAGAMRRDGHVFVNGELWRARAADGGSLQPGQAVSVQAVGADLVLTVAPAPTAGSTD